MLARISFDEKKIDLLCDPVDIYQMGMVHVANGEINLGDRVRQQLGGEQ